MFKRLQFVASLTLAVLLRELWKWKIDGNKMVLFGLERNFTRVAVSAFNSPDQVSNEEGLQMIRM